VPLMSMFENHIKRMKTLMPQIEEDFHALFVEVLGATEGLSTEQRERAFQKAKGVMWKDLALKLVFNSVIFKELYMKARERELVQSESKRMMLRMTLDPFDQGAP
jgi:hypothetical protein